MGFAESVKAAGRRAIPALLAALGVVLLCSGYRLNKARGDYAFIGDSLTQAWSLPRHNFGIHGQERAQILARFPVEVIGHGFRRAYILAGTNDVELHVDPAVTIRNLNKMVDVAQAGHVEPVLAEIPPIFAQNGIYMKDVQELNRRIVQLSQARHVTEVDYFDAIGDHPGYTSDGLHMNRMGYLMMDLALIKGVIDLVASMVFVPSRKPVW
jgi:hypothetical protein